MAAIAARSLRSLARSTACINKSSLSSVRKAAAAKGISSTSLSLLLEKNGRIGSRTVTLTSRIAFSRKFSPTIVTCCIPKVSPLAVECAGESCESVEGSLGDDDGETWSLNDDENYVEGS